MRSLASIQRIREITPIEGSDFLEAAHILGWQCVVKKGEFKAGDLGVYFEVDSFLPEQPRYEFLRASSWRDNADNGQGFRIKTAKLRGALSQGLILPLAAFPEIAGRLAAGEIGEGADLTETLGVKKWYIPEAPGDSGTIVGERPAGIPATDEIRIQSAPELIEELRGRRYTITTKMDGTSCIVYYIDGKLGCCSRNKEIKDEETALYWKPVYLYHLKERLARRGKNIVLAGELCGPGIQKNRLRLPDHAWYVFDAKDHDAGRYHSYDETQQICADLGVPTVPLEERGESFGDTLETLLQKARGKYPSGLDKEGIVVRSADAPKSISFKVLNNDALLKEKG
jgi:RNA ligase (TIGR02306 family)